MLQSLRTESGKKKIKWTTYLNERVIATAITINKQVVTLMSIYMPHSGYADYRVEKVYSEIEQTTTCSKNMLIIVGDFNAELGPGQGAEKLSVGRYTLNESNKRGDWLKQRMMSQRLVALNTTYRKQADKQTTFRSPKGKEKQLDYILTSLTSRRHLKFSKDAEAMICYTWRVITEVSWHNV